MRLGNDKGNVVVVLDVVVKSCNVDILGRKLGLSRELFENKGQCELLEIRCHGRRSGGDRVEVLNEWVCKARQGLSGFSVRGLPRLEYCKWLCVSWVGAGQ
jgi:hypothetical protein